MKQLIQVLNYEGNQVRTATKEGEVWFVAKDVCDALDISKYRDAVSKLDEDERMSVLVDTLGGKQEMSAVNEYGLYELIFASRKEEVKPFKRWVKQVIKQIRKTGTYGVTKETKLLEQTQEATDAIVTYANKESEVLKEAKELFEEINKVVRKLEKGREGTDWVMKAMVSHHVQLTNEMKQLSELPSPGSAKQLSEPESNPTLDKYRRALKVIAVGGSEFVVYDDATLREIARKALED